MKPFKTLAFPAALALCAASSAAQDAGGHFIVRDLPAGTEEAADSIRSFVEENEDWLLLAEFPLKGGEVQAMKICYLPIGADVFAAGMHVAAMMPCGNLAFYEEAGQPRLSMLDPSYLTALSPHPGVARAAETLGPAFEEMLATTTE